MNSRTVQSDSPRAAQRRAETPPRRPLRDLMRAWMLAIVASATAGAATVRADELPPKARFTLEQIEPAPALPPASAPADGAAPDVPRASARRLQAASDRYAAGLWTDTISEAQEALRLAPDLAEAHLLLARAALQQGNDKLAETHLVEALRLAPRDARVHQSRARLAWQAQRYDDAIVSGRLALLCAPADGGTTPDLLLARLYLGLSLFEQGYLTAAREQLEAYAAATERPAERLQRDPQLRAALVLLADRVQGRLADIYEALGDHPRAADALARAAALNEDDPELRARWVRGLARAGRRDEALALARRLAAELEPAAGVALLDEVCGLLGEPGLADRELADLARADQRPELALLLARRQQSRGRSGAALELLEQARQSNPNDSDVALRAAQGYADAARWDDFLGVVLDVIRRMPQDARRALDLLEESAANAESRAALVKSAESTAKDAASDPAVAVALASLLQVDGQSDQATTVLERAHRFAHEHAAADANKVGPPGAGALSVALAKRWLAEHRWSDVASLCRTAIDSGVRESGVYLMLGDALDADDRSADAEAAYREAGQLARRDAEPLLRLGRLLERRGELARAEQAYREVVESVDPRCEDAHEALVRLYLASSRGERAMQQAKEVRRLRLKGPTARRALALVDASMGDNDGRVSRVEVYRAALREILKDNPRDAGSLVDLAAGLTSEGKYEEALRVSDDLMAAAPDHVAGRELRLAILASLLRQDEAHELLSAMIRERPRNARWRARMANLAIDRQDDATAVEQLEYLIAREDLKSDRLARQNELIQVLTLAGQADRAVAAARRALEEHANDEKDAGLNARREMLVRALEWNGRTDEAVAEARRLYEAEPTRSDARLSYVARLVNAGRTLPAAQLVLGWSEDEPDNDAMPGFLAEVLRGGGDAEQAIALLRARGAARGGEDARLLLSAYMSAGRYDDAAELVRNAQRGAARGEGEFELIDVCLRAGRLDEAERLLNRLLEPQLELKNAGEPYDPRFLSLITQQLAMVYDRTGRSQRAISLLEGLLEQSPGDPGVNNDLGYTMAESGRDLERAEMLIRRAVAREPRVAAYLDSLAWVLYKRGSFEPAAEWMRRSLRWSKLEALQRWEPVDPVLADHAGDIAWRLGRRDEAIARWKQSLASFADRRYRPLDRKRDEQVRQSAEHKLQAAQAGSPPPVAAIAGEQPASQPTDD